MLHLLGCPCSTTAAQPTEADPGFVIDPEKKAEWLHSFLNHLTPMPLPAVLTAAEVDKAADQLLQDIQKANETTFCKHQPFHPKASPWWNAVCTIAVQNL
jgi:hypothetical protein